MSGRLSASSESVSRLLGLLSRTAALSQPVEMKSWYFLQELSEWTGGSWFRGIVNPWHMTTVLGVDAAMSADVRRFESFPADLCTLVENSTNAQFGVCWGQKSKSCPVVFLGYRRVNPDKGMLILLLSHSESNRENGCSEKSLVELTLMHSFWMYEQPENETHMHDLQPGRLGEVLKLMLEGLCRKQIADLLNLEENTIAGYTRELYRRYGVRSHPELMRKAGERINI